MWLKDAAAAGALRRKEAHGASFNGRSVKPGGKDASLCMRLSSFGLTCATSVIAATTPLTAASAQPRWKEIGKTSTGNSVYVDPASVKSANGIITARIRVRFATPVKLRNGEQWAVSHDIAMFDCAKSAVAGKETIYYSDDAATHVVQRSKIAKPGFGPALGGSMTKVALDYLCKK